MTDETNTPLAISEENVSSPDWETDDDLDLRDHARALVGKFANNLIDRDDHPARPRGTTAHAHITVPCPVGADVAKRLVYLSYCAEVCKDLDLLVREVQVQTRDSTDPYDQKLVVLSCCTESGFYRAVAELAEDERAEGSDTTH